MSSDHSRQQKPIAGKIGKALESGIELRDSAEYLGPQASLSSSVNSTFAFKEPCYSGKARTRAWLCASLSPSSHQGGQVWS